MITIINDSEANGEHKELVGSAIIVIFGLIFLALTFPKRFIWAYRTFCLLVFIFYLWYFIDEKFIQGKSFFIESSTGSQSPINALRGLIVFGIPSLLYFILGTTKKERQNKGLIKPDTAAESSNTK